MKKIYIMAVLLINVILFNTYTYATVNDTSNKLESSYLSSINIEGYSLLPEFNKDVNEYVVVIDESITSITIKASAESQNATVLIEGNDELNNIENEITITVKTKNNSKRKYKIKVKKVNMDEYSNSKLESLQVEGYTITPEFNSNVYNYTISTENNPESLFVVADSKNKNANIEIIGADKIDVDNKVITVNVTAEDGNSKSTYEIKINKKSVIFSFLPKENLVPFIALIIVGILILVFLGIILFKKQ